MIPKETADKFIASKEKINLTKASFSKFSAKYKTLGIIISRLVNTANVYHYNYTKLYKETFGNDVSFNPWVTKEGLQLAKTLFGPIRAPYIAEVWELLNTLPYQNGYDRRPFRKEPDIDFVYRKIAVLQNLYSSGVNFGFGDMTFKEQLQYDVYYQNGDHAYLFAVVIEKGEENLTELITDIINAEDEIGGVTRQLINALLLTTKPAYWQLVGKLLLAAQRQEGLRQTILESLDQTQIGALQYIIKIVLENDLMRFSSVVRAVDTWFGFGWEAPKKSTIKRILELTHHLLENKTAIDKYLKSNDFIEIYVSLWVIGITDVHMAIEKAFEILYNNPNKNYKLLALFFVNETERTNTSIISYFEKEVGKDVEIDYWMLHVLPEHKFDDTVFEKLISTTKALPSKGKEFKSAVFSWKNYRIEPDYFYYQLIEKANDNQLQAMASDISAIASTSREGYIKKLFPDHYTYYWNARSNEKIKRIATSTLGWKRNVIHQAILDRNQTVMATGVTLFNAIELQAEEINILETIFERKNKQLRQASIQLLVKQPEEVVKTSTQKLIHSKKIDQRLAALEILSILDEQNIYPTFVNEQIETYKQRSSFHKNEAVFLEKFNTNSTQHNFANGFGVIDYDNLTPLYIPQKKFKPKKGLLDGLLGKNERIITRFIDEKKTIKVVNQLIDLFKKNENHEYQYKRRNGEVRTRLISEEITTTAKNEDATDQEKLEGLPLAKLWIDWYHKSKLNDYELEAAIHFSSSFSNPYGYYNPITPYLKNYIPNLEELHLHKGYHYNTINANIATILKHLLQVFGDLETLNQFKTDLLEDAIANFPKELKMKRLDTNSWRNENTFWCDALANIPYLNSAKNTKRTWQLTRFLMAQSLGHPKVITNLKAVLQSPPKKNRFPRTSEATSFSLYRKNEITKDDVLLESILSESHIITLDAAHRKDQKWIQELHPPYEIYPPLKKSLLQIELERGELETEASKYITKMGPIEGVHYFFSVLERLEKSNFERGYSYNHLSKTSTFSTILQYAIPSETDTYEAFATQLKASKITKKRLIETACYATQWANWIGRYLNLNDLESAVWWFHAHSSDYASAAKETVISRYSNVPMTHFAVGAIDIDWFYKIYNNVGKANWKLLHEASKYISSGMAHRQVKLYSGVLLGEIKITETLKRITEKRDKDYVRALGLIPLSKSNPENDLLKRYNLLQTFLKESKQFGAQRQESEKNAVEIALENLSRNAGYSDSVRFSWAMEAKSAQKIMENATVTIDDIVVQLVVNKEGKADLKIEKNGKAQKTIPKKHQKNKAIIRLKEAKSFLSKQYARTRLSLEKAMTSEADFTKAEIKKIMLHPVVEPMLSKLVLFEKEKQIAGFWHDGKLIDTDGTMHPLDENDHLIIAHPSHLYAAVQWDLFQQYLFDKQIKQPFKQVFRELYIITKNEKEVATRSERYQGHQIQPKKTIALLRSRGWTVNYEEGLQKVYHKHGFMVSMYAMADWYSPADIEAPTIEYVAFTALKDYKQIPLNTISPLIFSEVMRDVDLVVSVAHVGGVDPEASHSTMEMRAVLARESARLFKLDNIEVKERHIIITGKLGTYSIHLGSGKVSKSGLQLSIIPVHSQHRGRLFLPFVDDDPKSAEIISKMKLLAEDHKIQDPTVLAQLNKN